MQYLNEKYHLNDQVFINFDKEKWIKCIQLDSRNDLAFKRAKLLEEKGELAQAILGISESANKSKSSGEVAEEAIDICLVALDLYFNLIPEPKVDPDFNQEYTMELDINQILVKAIHDCNTRLDDHRPQYQIENDRVSFILGVLFELEPIRSNFMELIYLCFVIMVIAEPNEQELLNIFNKKIQKWYNKVILAYGIEEE